MGLRDAELLSLMSSILQIMVCVAEILCAVLPGPTAVMHKIKLQLTYMDLMNLSREQKKKQLFQI